MSETSEKSRQVQIPIPLPHTHPQIGLSINDEISTLQFKVLSLKRKVELGIPTHSKMFQS